MKKPARWETKFENYHQGFLENKTRITDFDGKKN